MSIRDPRHRKGAKSAANAQIATGKTPNQQKGTKAADHASVDAVDAARRKENAKKGGCGPVEGILRRLAATYVVVGKKGPDVRRRRGEDRIRLPRIHPRASVRSTRRPEPFQIGTFAPVFHGTMFQSRKQIMAVDPPDLTKYKPTILNNSDGKEMRIILAASAILASIVSAQAATHHKHHHHRFIVRHSSDRHRVADRGSIVAHPTGCPRSAFCGCGVSARVFGHSVRSLWLVRNWYQFPRAAAAPGNVVLFGTRHVAYIEAVHGDGTATLYDPNSGGGMTRMHRVRIAGLAIVSPNGHATAEARTPPHAYRVARRHYRYQEQRTRYAYNVSGTTGFWH